MEDTAYREGGMPRIGDKAPEFKANTTEGPINFPSDYKGKWIILFSHPADFTPVCTSEFVTFGYMREEFESLNCQLVGLSVDGLSSHIAWLHTIKEKIEYNGMNHVDARFPLIEDISMHVSRLYGMIQPHESETKAVRAVFFIDPEGTVRALIYYPLSLGRNFDELKRVLIGLQTTDAYKVSLPADWRPGMDVIVPAPTKMEEIGKRETEDDVTCHDWFFCTRRLPAQEVEKLFKKRK